MYKFLISIINLAEIKETGNNHDPLTSNTFREALA